MVDRGQLQAGHAAGRIVGLDVARALAILVMVVVHFALVAGRSEETGPLMANLLNVFDGRAAATFLVLAGIGISMLAGSTAQRSDAKPSHMRRVLWRRGLFLLALGFLNLLVWPGDILRVYGVSLILAIPFLGRSGLQLIGAAVASVLIFLVMFVLVDYETHWDWETLTYRDLWTWEGVLRNLFYDGFRSVFPWIALLWIGMWLGRLDLRNRVLLTRLFGGALVLAVTTEWVSRLLLNYTSARWPQDREWLTVLWGTQSMPPLPMFLVSATSTAVAVICGCVLAAQRLPERLVAPLACTGQLALTWYVLHIVVGLGTIVALDAEQSQPTEVAALWGVLFFAGVLAASLAWKARFAFGPIEAVMRAISK